MQDFYRDATVFVTGATGYVGHALLEKLLRSCPSVRTVYILVRDQKGKTPEDRVKDMFTSVFFDKLKQENQKFKKCITIISGELQEDNLGISNNDWNTLTKEVNIVFHIAATVRFDEKLRTATCLNVIGTKNVLELCKECEHLKSFVYVSTAYSNCNRSEIEEIFYPPPISPHELIDLVDKKSDEELKQLETKLLKDFPNTYTFTKCLAEDLVRMESTHLPVCVVRPSIVMGPWREPLPGFAGNLNGPFGLMTAVGYGLLHVIHVDTSTRADIVPLDMLANTLLAAGAAAKSPGIKDGRVYNFVSGNQNALKWRVFYMWCMHFASPYALLSSYWCYYLVLIKNETLFNIVKFLLHTIPGYFVDCGLKLSGNKPMVMKMYKRIHKNVKLIDYFNLNEWRFHDENTQALFASLSETDRKLFNFDIKDVEWDLYFMYTIRSIRIHLCKDPMSTAEEAQKKYTRLKRIAASVFAIAVILLYFVIKTIF